MGRTFRGQDKKRKKKDFLKFRKQRDKRKIEDDRATEGIRGRKNNTMDDRESNSEEEWTI